MKQQSQSPGEDGFSYIDVMCGLIILTVGILGMVAALTNSLIQSYSTEQRIVSKNTVQSTTESIFAARDIRSANGLDSWGKIGNVGTNPDANGVFQGVFVTGWTPVREDAGFDGVVGTADDSCSGTAACQVGSNPANNSPIVRSIERKIEISDIPTDTERRQIIVQVRYPVGQVYRTERYVTLISNLRLPPN